MRIMKALLTINHLQPDKHFNSAHSECFWVEEPLPKPQVWYRLPNGVGAQWNGLIPLLTWRRGYVAMLSPQGSIWLSS